MSIGSLSIVMMISVMRAGSAFDAKTQSKAVAAKKIRITTVPHSGERSAQRDQGSRSKKGDQKQPSDPK